MTFNSVRKSTITRIKNNGEVFNGKLPNLERLKIREKESIAVRAIILSEFKALSLYPEDKHDSMEFMKEYEFWEGVSAYEKTALMRAKFSKQEEIDFSWYKESLYALFWSLGFVKKMSFPVEECDVIPFLKEIPPDKDFQDFLLKINLRTKIEIERELDFYYCLHWMSRHQNTNLNESVVIERRKALEWVANKELKWDNILLDT